ncbi:unnamed protein product [Acanthosepion pharaonis]|uniref:ubiquitinyl hydrolase 1 n=1 Tax=Acanthosepion pharaonis TaxID=158019 RepID=A0A812CBH8_ACAPH|nr:unnamed protein product [Sepia pharaonis]
MEEVQSSVPNLLFEGSLDTATSSEIFSDMPDLKQEGITNKSVTSSDVGYTSSIGQLHRSPKDIESPAAFYGCCGFYNLGNTCFMNAGLQCLFCNTHLVKFFHEQFVLNDVSKDTLTGKFCQLVRKVWSGNFSLIHPLDFKGTLGMYYPQFHDFRQHDCQEFVTLLLDSLHESLNNARNNNNNNNNNAFQKPMQATSSKSEQMAHALTHSSSLDTSSSSSMNVITQKSHSSVSSSLSYSTKHTISAAATTEAVYEELVAAAATTTTATNSTSLATHNQNNSHMFSLQHEQQAVNTAMGISSSSKLKLASYNTASAISNKVEIQPNTVRVEEIMADPGCTMDEENDEEEEDMAMEKDDDVDDTLLEDEEAEVSSVGERHCKTSLLHESPGPDADYTTADIEAADHSWGCHLIKNNSIVVDTFHGQFKNTVVCSECCHVSVTYEPFMYLSVPIPHAMERQLCVIFMPQVRSMPPVRYLLNLNKNDNIYKAKTELREVASQPDCDIIMVEVVDSHITRVLDDNILLRFVNDSARKIYAFEMAAPPSSLDSSPTDSIGDLSAVSSSFSAKEDLTTVQPCSSTSPDIFTNMDTFTLDSFTPPSTPATVALSSVSNTPINTSYTAGFTNTVTASSCKLKAPLSADTETSVMESVPPNPTSTDETTSGTSKCFSSSSVFPDSAMKEESDLCDSSVVSQQQQLSSHSKSEVNATNSPNMWDWPPPVTSPSSVAIPMTWESNLDTCDQPQQQPIVSSSSLPPMAEHWRSCAICLEELLDTGLMVHASCGGTFCHSCLEMSLKHHSVFSYTCPVCLAFANPSVEFVPLADPESKRLRTRILAVPIAFRCLSKTDSDQLVLVGHPHILYLPNNISGNVLYSCVDQVVPALLEYTIVYTTEEGLQCSRCPSFNQCHGCIVQRMGRITLQPGDHLTVMLNNISTKQLDELMQQYVIDHDSMENLRPDTPMSIYDCFRAFMQSETLDEHNPWFCPSCCKNCRAKKTMTVWRYPDNLIIYLKRFVFHELTSTKIDNLVSFPLEHLDLSEFSSGPRTKHLIYDLHSIVCHFGGSNSGHYTCYAKHPKEDVWYYYNDETVCQQVPRDDHMSSAYVLFYVRQGTDVSFQVPDKASYQFLDSGLNNSPTYNNATTQKPLNSGYAKGIYLYSSQCLSVSLSLCTFISVAFSTSLFHTLFAFLSFSLSLSLFTSILLYLFFLSV